MILIFANFVNVHLSRFNLKIKCNIFIFFHSDSAIKRKYETVLPANEMQIAFLIKRRALTTQLQHVTFRIMNHGVGVYLCRMQTGTTHLRRISHLFKCGYCYANVNSTSFVPLLHGVVFFPLHHLIFLQISFSCKIHL